MALSAYGQFCKATRIIRLCTAFCGTDVGAPNYEMWALTYAVLAAIFFFFACTIYTLYVGVVLNKDWTVILQAFAMAGSAVQGLTKMLCTLNNAVWFREIQATYDSIYKEYEAKGGEYTQYLDKRIKNFWRLMVLFIWIYVVVSICLVFHPIFQYVVYKEKLLVMQFLVPGLNHKTDNGHLMLVTLHIMCLSFGAFGNFGGDMFLFLYITNVPLIKDIFKVKLHAFNELVVQKNRYKETRQKLWEALAWHQKYVGILRHTEKVYKVVMFVQLSTTCVGILCTISCIFLKVWPTAVTYLFYSFVVLYTFCGLGTIVETSNEDFSDEIYSNCLWYELPVTEQKLVILMLAKSQNEVALTAANVFPLSMATAMQLTKGIYSFSMMLFTYLE